MKFDVNKLEWLRTPERCSVITNHGYSDWATTAIPSQVKTMWYRFSRREDDYCIECSQDGEHFTQMRVCPPQGRAPASFYTTRSNRCMGKKHLHGKFNFK